MNEQLKLYKLKMYSDACFPADANVLPILVAGRRWPTPQRQPKQLIMPLRFVHIIISDVLLLYFFLDNAFPL